MTSALGFSVCRGPRSWQDLLITVAVVSSCPFALRLRHALLGVGRLRGADDVIQDVRGRRETEKIAERPSHTARCLPCTTTRFRHPRCRSV